MNWKKTFRIVLFVLVISLGLFIYYNYFWVFAEGTKAGVLNTIQEKGYVFKTYEGELIQSGFKTNIQSNEFFFSVTDKNIADRLQQNSGLEVNLHYKLYKGSLPWRGMQPYIVDSIYEIRGAEKQPSLAPTIEK